MVDPRPSSQEAELDHQIAGIVARIWQAEEQLVRVQEGLHKLRHQERQLRGEREVLRRLRAGGADHI